MGVLPPSLSSILFRYIYLSVVLHLPLCCAYLFNTLLEVGMQETQLE